MPEELVQATPAPDAGGQAASNDNMEGAAPALANDNKPAPTILNGDASPPVVQVAPADWPTDWRAKMAGEDAAYTKTLDRYASPMELAKAHRELQQKLSREPRAPILPGPDATPEERQAYRKQIGVPDEPNGYDVKVAEGFVWGETDKPMLDDFTKYAHSQDMRPDEVKKALGWYAQFQEQSKTEQARRDEATRINGIDELRTEWGAQNYEGNINAVENLAARWGKEASEEFLGARGPSGRKLGSIPSVLKALAQTEIQLNPAAKLVPAGTQDQGKAVGSRLQELDKMMSDYSGPYWRGDRKDELQQEYRDLLDAQQRLSGKTGGNPPW